VFAVLCERPPIAAVFGNPELAGPDQRLAGDQHDRAGQRGRLRVRPGSKRSETQAHSSAIWSGTVGRTSFDRDLKIHRFAAREREREELRGIASRGLSRNGCSEAVAHLVAREGTVAGRSLIVLFRNSGLREIPP